MPKRRVSKQDEAPNENPPIEKRERKQKVVTADTLKMREVFPERVRLLVQELGGRYRNVGLTELQKKTGISYDLLSHYEEGENIGSLPTLLALAKGMHVSADWLLGLTDERNPSPHAARSSDVGDVTVKIGGDNFAGAREKLVRRSRHALWILGRTGSTFDWSSFSPALEAAFKDNKISLRMVLSDPNDKCTIDMISRARTSVSDTPEAAKKWIESTQTEVERRALHPDVPKPEIRMIPYAASYHACIRDPESGDGEALVILVNFRGDEFRYAPLMTVYEAQHKEMFDFFCNDFLKHWNYKPE